MSSGTGGYGGPSPVAAGGEVEKAEPIEAQPLLAKVDSSLLTFGGHWKSTMRPVSTVTIYGDTVTMCEPDGSNHTVGFSASGDGSCMLEAGSAGKLSADGQLIQWGQDLDNDVWLRLPLLAVGQEVKVTLIGTLVEKEESGVSWTVKIGDQTFSINRANLEHIEETEAELLKQGALLQETPITSTAAATAAMKKASIAAATVAAAHAVAHAAKAKEVAAAGAARAGTAVAAGAAKGASKVQNWLRGRFERRAEETTNVTAQRRRLSVGHVTDDDDQADAVHVEADRGLVVALDSQSLMDIIGSGEASHVESVLEISAVSAFKCKELHEAGKPLSNDTGLGYTCRKGLKPESPNQDSFFHVKVLDDFSLYGVIDGHGQKGHEIASFVKTTLPKIIVQDSRFSQGLSELPSVCTDSFAKMQRLIEAADRMKKVNAQMSGCSASVVIHDHKRQELTVAHVADSTVCLFSKTPDGIWKTRQLTTDHKPDLKDERARIEKAGGRVVFDGYANHRVYAKNGRYPGLNMSRCLGDLLGHSDAGISAVPDVSRITLEPDDAMLVICSDGVWEFMTPTEVCGILSQCSKEESMLAADKVAKEAWNRWIQEEGGAVVDDITVVLQHLSVASPSAVP